MMRRWRGKAWAKSYSCPGRTYILMAFGGRGGFSPRPANSWLRRGPRIAPLGVKSFAALRLLWVWDWDWVTPRDTQASSTTALFATRTEKAGVGVWLKDVSRGSQEQGDRVIVGREIPNRKLGATHCAGRTSSYTTRSTTQCNHPLRRLNTQITHKCRAAIFPPLAILWRIVIGNCCFPGRWAA
jgi:hypothetical protein